MASDYVPLLLLGPLVAELEAEAPKLRLLIRPVDARMRDLERRIRTTVVGTTSEQGHTARAAAGLLAGAVRGNDARPGECSYRARIPASPSLRVLKPPARSSASAGSSLPAAAASYRPVGPDRAATDRRLGARALLAEAAQDGLGDHVLAVNSRGTGRCGGPGGCGQVGQRGRAGAAGAQGGVQAGGVLVDDVGAEHGDEHQGPGAALPGVGGEDGQDGLEGGGERGARRPRRRPGMRAALRRGRC
jgi:hypothetical protein